jgi:hypothetical protein
MVKGKVTLIRLAGVLDSTRPDAYHLHRRGLLMPAFPTRHTKRGKPPCMQFKG